MNAFDLKCLIEDNYIKTDIQRKWFNDMLSKVTIRIYDTSIENEKKSYDNYCKEFNLKLKEFRGMSWENGIIMLNNIYETQESLCWILLHELGHMTAVKIKKTLGYDLLVMLSGGSLNDMSKEEYNEYVSNDVIHEARYEEQFANQFANTIIGKSYDRYWWRKNKDLEQ